MWREAMDRGHRDYKFFPGMCAHVDGAGVFARHQWGHQLSFRGWNQVADQSTSFCDWNQVFELTNFFMIIPFFL